ncbi:MAG: hypothetical protein JF887_14375 [Candidatus Dormibacteraeota bacterium]|uniref:Uncharacterized protein n=1 Tax=Candidatus Amunia macphersoniae TaxID=3127014 RepID=A0A934KRS9_9BACT|nr:hypothetical protein [Candidatus Dormibacteraeota bacterium]
MGEQHVNGWRVSRHRPVADATVGVIANPMSGRDIRRLVASAWGPGYANRLQHADDLGPPSHNLTVRLHPVRVRMQQPLERAPVTLDDRGMRA